MWKTAEKERGRGSGKEGQRKKKREKVRENEQDKAPNLDRGGKRACVCCLVLLVSVVCVIEGECVCVGGEGELFVVLTVKQRRACLVGLG